jgi:hypothetical protein
MHARNPAGLLVGRQPPQGELVRRNTDWQRLVLKTLAMPQPRRDRLGMSNVVDQPVLSFALDGEYERVAYCAVAPRRHDRLPVEELQGDIFARLSTLRLGLLFGGAQV